MICIKCGNEFNEETCPFCGEENHHIRIKERKYKNKKHMIIVATTLVIFALLSITAFRSLGEYAKLEFIEFNNEKVPTIASVIGIKEVTNYSKDKKSNTIIYDYSQFKNEEIDSYLTTLFELNYVMYEVEGDGLGLLKEIDENGKIILINLSIKNGNLKIVYEYKQDSIKNYKLDGNIKVGNEFVGYMKIPAHFSKLKITDESIKYVNVNNKKEFVTMKIDSSKKTLFEYTANKVKEFEGKNATIKRNPITVYGYSGFQIDASSNSEKLFLRSYIFIKENSDIYEITLESDDNSTSLFSSIYTYEVVK